MQSKRFETSINKSILTLDTLDTICYDSMHHNVLYLFYTSGGFYENIYTKY